MIASERVFGQQLWFKVREYCQLSRNTTGQSEKSLRIERGPYWLGLLHIAKFENRPIMSTSTQPEFCNK